MDYPKSVPNIGLIDGHFVDENPVTGQIGSLIPAAWGDAITQELLNVIKGAGLVPDEGDVSQLLQAITLISASDYKRSVRCATTGPIALSGLQTIDGIALTAGARVLVKDQATARQNGIYLAAAGAWSRAADADSSAAVSPGMTVPVEQGTLYEDTIWELTTNGTIVLGTTALVFELTAALNATQGDAETGTNNTRRMTALRVFQAIRSLAATATEALRGVMRVGTQTEVNEGSLDNVAVTPKKLRFGVSWSLGNNGYLALPSWLGGFIWQWGVQAVSSTSSTYSVPIPFPNAFYNILMTDGATGSGLQDFSAEPGSLSTYIAMCSANGNLGRYYAFGR